MCNTLISLHYNDEFSHTNISKRVKSMKKAYKVVRKTYGHYIPVFRLSPSFKETKNIWDFHEYGDGFTFYTNKKDAIDTYNKNSCLYKKLLLISCEDIIGTFTTKEVIGKKQRVGLCKKFTIIKELL